MKKKVRIYKKPCYKCGGQPHMEKGGAFEPHIMFDPKTGKGYPAETMEDHLAMKEQGFLHKDEMPKKQFGGKQFGKRLAKELKSNYKPFSSTAPQNQNTDEVVGERKNMFVSELSNNAFVKMAEEEQQSLQQLHQQMKMGGAPMYDQYGGQYTANKYMPKMQDGGDTEETGLDPTDPSYIEDLLYRYSQKYGTTAVKGFGDYEEGSSKHPIEEYADNGEAQRAALIGYMEAMIKGDIKSLMDEAKILDQTDLPDFWSWDVMPNSDEDKLEDMAAMAREEARANVYHKVMAQVDEIDQNFDAQHKELEKELRKKIASGNLTAQEKAIVTENLEKLNRIKGVIAKDKRNEVINYELKGQIDWDRGNWGQAYIDYLNMYNDTFGKKDGDGNFIDKPLKYDLVEQVSGDLSNSTRSSGSYAKLDKVIPFNKTKFIDDDLDTHTQTDQYLKDYKPEKSDEDSGQEPTEDVGAGADDNQTQATTTTVPPTVEVKPDQQKVSNQQQQNNQKPIPRKDPAGYESPSKNVITGRKKYTEEEKQAILERVEAANKKYGGELEKYQLGKDYTDKLGTSYEYDWGANEEEEKSNFFNIFRNPNRDYGYSRGDGVQIRMNRRGDEKIDLAGTYANAFRANPWATGIGTAARALDLGARAKLAINEAKEDKRFEDFMQKQTLADNQFMPYSDVMRKGDYTVNQAYSNPMLATMASPYGGDIYQYGGDVYMSDEEIEEFLKAGGQIEYLD